VRIYHILPKQFVGPTLYPFNQLKDVLPDIFTQQATKYRGRDELLEYRIPILDCYWNDLLHLSAIHPAQIRGAMEASGMVWKMSEWFEIDVEKLDLNESNATIFTAPFRLQGAMQEQDFIPFNVERLQMLTSIPQESYEYFNHAKAYDEHPFLFNYIPHVLYHGTLDTTALGVTRIAV
jgi:hypothetical protein